MHGDYDGSGWFRAGFIGWFLFLYVFNLETGKAVSSLILTLLIWIPVWDIICIHESDLKTRLSYPPDLRTLCGFVLLPYALGALWVCWGIRRKRLLRKPAPDPPGATNR